MLGWRSKFRRLLEGEQLVMGFNDTMVTLPEITEERIREVQTLGFFSRDGWIPIDPTASVCTFGLFPFLADLYLVFGYGAFLGVGGSSTPGKLRHLG